MVSTQTVLHRDETHSRCKAKRRVAGHLERQVCVVLFQEAVRGRLAPNQKPGSGSGPGIRDLIRGPPPDVHPVLPTVGPMDHGLDGLFPFRSV